MIVGVVVDVWKQRCMCYLNALYIKKKGKMGRDCRIKGYHVRSDELEKETMRYMRVMWNSRQRH